ncbi:hypothetical protein, partial [Thiorhodococcus fuscus]
APENAGPSLAWTGNAVDRRFARLLPARMCADDRVGRGRAGDEIVTVDSPLDSVGDGQSDCHIGRSVFRQRRGLTDR